MAKPKHYSYRMDYDLGFAPHIQLGLCSVCGCKRTTVEKGATPGSWVIGIGGKGTGQPKLIYAVKIEDTPSYDDFKRKHHVESEYSLMLANLFRSMPLCCYPGISTISAIRLCRCRLGYFTSFLSLKAASGLQMMTLR